MMDLKAICRICFKEEAKTSQNMISPCSCSGSIEFVHHNCLKKLFKFKRKLGEFYGIFRNCCDICGNEYRIKEVLKPYKEWISVFRKKIYLLVLTLFILINLITIPIFIFFYYYMFLNYIENTNDLNSSLFKKCIMCLLFFGLYFYYLLLLIIYRLFKLHVNVNSKMKIASIKKIYGYIFYV